MKRTISLLLISLIGCTAAQYQTFVSDVTKLGAPSLQLIECAFSAVGTAVLGGGGVAADITAAVETVQCMAQFGVVVSTAEASAAVASVKPGVLAKIAAHAIKADAGMSDAAKHDCPRPRPRHGRCAQAGSDDGALPRKRFVP